MIELAIKSDLERISGMKVYPLLLPKDIYTGITYLRVSDSEIETGLVRTGVIAGRFQITLYSEVDLTKIVKLDKAIWAEWKQVIHGDIQGYPVQYVRRGGISFGKETLPNGNTIYSLSRDFILTFSE